MKPRIRRFTATLAALAALSLMLASCGLLGESTATPLPTATATPGPTPTPVPEADQGLADSFATLPFETGAAISLDLQAIRAHPDLAARMDEVMGRYAGGVAAYAPILDLLDYVAVPLQTPVLVGATGDVNGSVILGALALGGFPTGDYDGVRFVQINRELVTGAPNYAAFPSRGIAVLAETLPGLEALLDVQLDGSTASMADTPEGRRALAATGAGMAVAIGSPAALEQAAFSFDGLGVDYAGLSMTAVEGNRVAARAYLLFTREIEAGFAELALTSDVTLAAMLGVEDASAIQDIRVERDGREVIVSATVPMETMIALIEARVGTTASP